VITEKPKGKNNKKIEKEMREELSRQFNDTVNKIRGYKSDVLGTGLIFRPYLSEKNLVDWKSKWFPLLEQKVNVRVNVLNEIYFKNPDTDKGQGGLLKSG
jgi:hypothetical protein